MGYRDDFYTTANMIGYSGNLNDFPTVYFQSGAEYGHITQKHPETQNVGRQAVGNDADYTIENRMVDGVIKLVESVGGRPVHVSRSTLTRIEHMGFEDQAMMAQAIWRCPNEKYISSWSRGDFDLTGQVMVRKGAVNQQLLGQ